MSSERLPEELEQSLSDRRLLVIACDPSGELSIEENGFPAWMVAGISDWLGMYADAEMQAELLEEEEEEP